MYFDILGPERFSVLRTLCERSGITGFYLAGGTGLSLQMKLRRSAELDFFSQKPFNGNSLCRSVESLFPGKTEVLAIDKRMCCLSISGIPVSFFEFPYRMTGSFVSGKPIDHLDIACIEDIAAMKIFAISGRGTKEDFFDLYHILTGTGMSSEQIISLLKRKFGKNCSLLYMLMGLDYFEDAEDEILPELFVDFDWNQTKAFFVQNKRELFNCAFPEFAQTAG